MAAFALLTSAHLGFGAEAVVAPETVLATPSVSVAAPAAGYTSRSLDAGVVIAPAAGTPAAATPTAGAAGSSVADAQPSIVRVPESKLARMSGVALFQQLALLDRADLSHVAEHRPQVIDRLLAKPPAATVMAAEWAGIGETARQRLTRVTPRLVGALEGVPYADRDAANRRYLADERDRLRHRLDAGVGRAVKSDLERRLHMLDQVAEAIRRGQDGLHRQLVSIDPVGEGRAAIAIGDLDTAGYVSFLVPGMFYGVDSRIVPWTGVASDVAVEEQAWLDRLGPTANDDATSAAPQRSPTVAVVSWIGYHTPTLVNVASLENAREGQQAMTAALRGLTAVRGSDSADPPVSAPTGAAPPYVSVLAHSYGSTAALLSLQEDDVSVDALAMVGSPGSPARSVSELHVRSGNVWVGAANWDPIADTGVFGSQPTSKAYGAHRLELDGEVDPITGQQLTGALSHNDYFAPGSESLRNMALIAVDHAASATGSALRAEG